MSYSKYALMTRQSLRSSVLYCHGSCVPLQMQRHNLAQHMQEFTQMHMHYMAEFLRGVTLGDATSKSLWPQGQHSSSSEDQVAAVPVSGCSGLRGAVSCHANAVNCQPSEELQMLREMDGRLVKQDHQLRELIILKDTQVNDVLVSQKTNACMIVTIVAHLIILHIVIFVLSLFSFFYQVE